MLKDTQAEREQMVKDMANRCKGIIEEAMKWAPDTMRSHLKEYINNKVPVIYFLRTCVVKPSRETLVRF
jgi:hypothetical protein